MIRQLIKLIRSKKEAGKSSSIGENSEISGVIDKRNESSKIDIGDECLINGILVTETVNSRISIGNNVFIGGSTTIHCVASVVVEDHVLISHDCLLMDSDNHSINHRERKNDLSDWRSGGNHDWSRTISKPIHIGSSAWIEARAIVLKGVQVGEKAVMGAGSVVTKNVPRWSIVAGNPTKSIRTIPKDER